MFPLGAIAAPLLVASAYGQLKIDFATNRHPQQSHVEARLAKRSGSFELTSYRMPHDEVSSTTITTGSIGTPAQNLRFLINPLVGVTSLPAFGSELCKDKVVNCTFGGSFKPEDSSTFEETDEFYDVLNFKPSLVYGYNMTGKFITDILKIGDVELKTKIGLLDTLHRQHNGESLSIPLPPILPLPMIGIGQNSSVMKALVGSGAIRSHGYSIYHTDHAEPEEPCFKPAGSDECNLLLKRGAFLFGAVDTEKYEGDLMRMDLMSRKIETYSLPVHDLRIPLHSIKLASDASDEVALSTDINAHASLWGGRETTMLPNSTVVQILEAAGATDNFNVSGSERPDFPLARVPCDAKLRKKGSVKLRFGGECGPEIEVPFDDFVIQENATDSKPYLATNLPAPDGGENIPWCVFGLEPAYKGSADDGDDGVYLSFAVVKHMYLAFDFVNMEVAMAKSKGGETKSNWVAFEKEGANIPRAIKVDPNAKLPGCKPLEEAADDSGETVKAHLGFLCTAVLTAVFALLL